MEELLHHPGGPRKDLLPEEEAASSPRRFWPFGVGVVMMGVGLERREATMAIEDDVLVLQQQVAWMMAELQDHTGRPLSAAWEREQQAPVVAESSE